MNRGVEMFKSLHLVDIEYKMIASNFLLDITDESILNNIARGKRASKTVKYSEKILVKNGDRDVALYVFEPDILTEEKLPVIYYMHGGGYIMGDARMNENVLKDIANKNNVKIISVEYTLATELPFPQDLEDAYVGLKYLFENAESLGINEKKVAIMGESAGGGLAARLSLKVRDEGEYHLIGQILIAPMLDYRTGGDDCPYKNNYAGEFVWTKASNQFAWKVLAGDKIIPKDQIPYFSPIMASNFEGIPKTVIIVGGLDLFVDENMSFAKKLLEAGVKVDLNVISGVFHLFQSIKPNSKKAKFFVELRDKYIEQLFT